MINAFAKSRGVAWGGGIVLGAAAGAAAWLYAGAGAATAFNRGLIALLAAFVAVNIALFTARLIAAREYQQRLLLLYESLDPAAFLRAMLPLKEKRMDASNRCTTLVHIANGYLYSGQPRQALAVLDSIQPPDKALEMRGLVAGNRATCLLAAGEPDKAEAAMAEARRIAADGGCKKEFAQKARHTLGYLKLCVDIARGRQTDLEALKKDFERSRAPLHRLDVQYRIALACRRSGDRAGMERSRAYLLENSGGTCYKEWAERL